MQGERYFNEDPEISRSIKTVRTARCKNQFSTTNLTGYPVILLQIQFYKEKLLLVLVSLKIDINASGIATCPGGNFTGIKTDTIVRYQLPNETVINRVTEVLSDGSISLAAVKA